MTRSEVGTLALDAADWPSEREGGRLFELAREAAPRGPCLEIGGFRRRSALYLAGGCRAAEGFPLFCIDANQELDRSSGQPAASTVEAFVRRAGDAALDNWVVTVITDPRVASRFWPDDNTSLLLGEGGHTRDDILGDVQPWLHTVQRGGYLCVRLPGGDQADLRALEGALPARRWELVDQVGELAILRRRRSLARLPTSNGVAHRAPAFVRDGVGGPRAALESSRHLGMVPAVSGEGWTILGQDGGQSIDLGQRTLFVFSDTLMALSEGGRRVFLGNTAAIGASPDLRDALSGARYLADPAGNPCEVVAPTPEEAEEGLRFWLEHGILVDGRVYLFYLGIFSEDIHATWAFENRGVGLAVLDPETGRCERLSRDGRWCLWPNTLDDLHIGVQVLREGEHVYVFGTRRFEPGGQDDAIVGRVHVSRIGDPGAYEFLCSPPLSPEWGPDPAAACSLGPCAPEYSLSFNPYLGVYTMWYIAGELKTLVLRCADSPIGPFGPPTTIGTLAHDPRSELVYLGFEHPQFREQDGRVVHLSYSQPRFLQNSLVRLRFP
jgi:hypothetical protein